jgi:hypothetical protein
VKTDNIGAMLIAQNALLVMRTCHIDKKYHCARENLKEAMINIEFSKSIENHSEIFAKNVKQEIC